jgi:hypothetical protein
VAHLPAGRYDLEVEKDRLGGALDDIKPLSAASWQKQNVSLVSPRVPERD